METKSLYISHVVSNFHGIKNGIWAGFGLDGSSEKQIWSDYKQLFRAFFSRFHRQKNFNLKKKIL
jgi:hypothetical protein